MSCSTEEADCRSDLKNLERGSIESTRAEEWTKGDCPAIKDETMKLFEPLDMFLLVVVLLLTGEAMTSLGWKSLHCCPGDPSEVEGFELIGLFELRKSK